MTTLYDQTVFNETYQTTSVDLLVQTLQEAIDHLQDMDTGCIDEWHIDLFIEAKLGPEPQQGAE